MKIIKTPIFTKILMFILNTVFLIGIFIIPENIFSKIFIIPFLILICYNLIFYFVLKNKKIAIILFLIFNFLIIVSNILSIFNINFPDNENLEIFLLGLNFFIIFIAFVSFIQNILFFLRVRKGVENVKEKFVTEKTQGKIFFSIFIFQIIFLIIFRYSYYFNDEKIPEVPENTFFTKLENKNINDEKNIYNDFINISEKYKLKNIRAINTENFLISKFPEKFDKSQIEKYEKTKESIIFSNNEKEIILKCLYENICYGDLFFYKILVEGIKNNKLNFENLTKEEQEKIKEDIKKLNYEKYLKYFKNLEEKIENLKKDASLDENYKNHLIEIEKNNILKLKKEKENLEIENFGIFSLWEQKIITKGLDKINIKKFLRENIEIFNISSEENEKIFEEFEKLTENERFFKENIEVDRPNSPYNILQNYTIESQSKIIYFIENGDEKNALKLIENNFKIYDKIISGDGNDVINMLANVNIKQILGITFYIIENKKVSTEFKKDLKNILQNTNLKIDFENAFKFTHKSDIKTLDFLNSDNLETKTSLFNIEKTKKLFNLYAFEMIKNDLKNSQKIEKEIEEKYLKNNFLKSNYIGKNLFIEGLFVPYERYKEINNFTIFLKEELLKNLEK